MKCPICSSDMINGDIVCRAYAAPTLYPKNADDSEWKHLKKVFFGSKDSIKTNHLDDGWYCPSCQKVLVLWSWQEDKL